MGLTFKELVLLYRAALDVAPTRGDTTRRIVNGELLRHVRWMLDHMPEDADSPRFHRWLGFVQAVLAMNGVYTIDQLMSQVRTAKAATPDVAPADAGSLPAGEG